jgi:hypothetical protein
MENLIPIVEHAVASHFGLADSCFKSGSRLRVATDAKHFLVYVLKEVYGFRQKEICERYGYSRRNVFMSAQMIREGVRHQPFYSRHYAAIMERLKTSGAVSPAVYDNIATNNIIE